MGGGTPVVGAGVLRIDYGVENAAWVEFDTAAPLPPADLAAITLGKRKQAGAAP
jgi:hypothetical protein